MESTWTNQYINSIKQIVRQTLRAKLGDYRDFEDVEQEALLRVFANRKRIPTGVTHNAYVGAIAKNCAYDSLRRKQRLQDKIQEVPLYIQSVDGDTDWLVEERFVSYPKEMSDPYVMQMVSKAISKLSPQHRAVLLLRAEKVEYKDIAKVLNISEGTVRSRLHYAKKRCAEQIAPNLN